MTKTSEHVNVEHVAAIVDVLVDRCLEHGQLVTINKHYPPAHEYAWRGFCFSSGVSLFIGVAVLAGKVLSWAGGMLP